MFEFCECVVEFFWLAVISKIRNWAVGFGWFGGRIGGVRGEWWRSDDRLIQLRCGHEVWGVGDGLEKLGVVVRFLSSLSPKQAKRGKKGKKTYV